MTASCSNYLGMTVSCSSYQLEESPYRGLAILRRSSGALMSLSSVLTMAVNFGRCDRSFCQQSNINWWMDSAQSWKQDTDAISACYHGNTQITWDTCPAQQTGSYGTLCYPGNDTRHWEFWYLPWVVAGESLSQWPWWHPGLTSSSRVSLHRTSPPTSRHHMTRRQRQMWTCDRRWLLAQSIALGSCLPVTQ